jgi:hypothetical protein
MRKLLPYLLLITVLFGATGLWAQDSSSMTGVVTDSTGAVVPGAAVVLANKSTGIKVSTVTDSHGSYRFPNVPPAEGYSASFDHSGFSTFTVNSVTLSVGITRTQNATLQAGENQQVEVSAANQAVTLNTTDASIGNNFDVQLLADLPIQNRDSPTALFTLQPGYAGGSFTGARTDQNSTSVDGMDTNDIAAGTGATSNPVGDAPVDSVQEFRGTIAGLPSNVGTGSGGQFQLVTKGGTNKFHGLLYEYHRDTVTAANAWFLNNTHIGRTPLIRNQFGGNIGGPILKNKLFFFFDYNNSRIIQSSSTSRVVPLDSYRSGNINYILAAPLTGGGTCAATTRLNTTPQCVGTLPNTAPAGAQSVTSLDPQHVGFDQAELTFINARYPHANDLTLGDGLNTGGYRFTQPTPDILYNYVGRIDYQMTSNQRIFARSTVEREDAIQGLNEFAGDPVTSPFQNRSYSYVVSHIWNIGQNKVNQFYYGDTISKLNFPNLYNPSGSTIFTLGPLAGPYISGSTQKRRIPIPEVRDDFNWVIGKHNLGAGGTFKFIKTNSNLVNDFSFVGVGLGSINSTLSPTLRPANIRGGSTAPSLYDSLFATALGHIGGISSNYNFNNAGQALAQGSGSVRRYRYYQTELYLGDTWKVTNALTLTYGLRYQLYSVPYESQGIQSNQNLTFDQLFSSRVAAANAGLSGDNVVPLVTYNLGGKANGAAPLYKPSYKDLAPRVAFAWNPGYSKKTVINGSAAIVYDRTVINAINFLQDQNSFLFQNNSAKNYGGATATAALASDPRVGANGSLLSIGSATIPTAPAIGKPYTPYVSGTTPFGGSSGTGYSYIVDPNLKDPYSIDLNLGLQQEFAAHFLLRANFVSRMGRRLIAQADAAQVVSFTDKASNQAFANAFAATTLQIRNGVSPTAVTAQPWFENVVTPGTGVANGYANNTQYLADNNTSLFQLGDIADFANGIEEQGLTANNVNVGAQFALNPWITNKGFSSYNGLLVTLTKNLSQGVQFDVNYTWSHSLDNVSAPANYQAASTLINFVCDATDLRKCRGNSDFDVQQVINTDFIAALPFGRGKMFLGSAPRVVDELVGGWSLSGTPAWHSGQAAGTLSGAFVASFNEDAPAVFNGNRGAVATHIHKSGSTLQAFSDQNAALATFSGPVGLTVGSRNNLRGPSVFSMDAGLGKVFPVYENVILKFRADFFNVLNHPGFGLPNTDITSTSFGQISSVSVGARVGQFALRLEF